MGVAIIKTHIQQGKADVVNYEARRFNSEEEARFMCSSQTHMNLLDYYDCDYNPVQKEVERINQLPPSKRKAAEEGLSLILIPKP